MVRPSLVTCQKPYDKTSAPKTVVFGTQPGPTVDHRLSSVTTPRQNLRGSAGFWTVSEQVNIQGLMRAVAHEGGNRENVTGAR